MNWVNVLDEYNSLDKGIKSILNLWIGARLMQTDEGKFGSSRLLKLMTKDIGLTVTLPQLMGALNEAGYRHEYMGWDIWDFDVKPKSAFEILKQAEDAQDTSLTIEALREAVKKLNKKPVLAIEKAIENGYFKAKNASYTEDENSEQWRKDEIEYDARISELKYEIIRRLTVLGMAEDYATTLYNVFEAIILDGTPDYNDILSLRGKSESNKVNAENGIPYIYLIFKGLTEQFLNGKSVADKYFIQNEK